LTLPSTAASSSTASSTAAPSSAAASPQIGLVVSSYSSYFAPVAFPAVVELGLRVNQIGTSSVVYEVGVFEEGQENVKAVGGFTHVFVDGLSRRPQVEGMTVDIRKGLERIEVGKRLWVRGGRGVKL
jgi:acyl-CoA thioester hydrolase